jgi:hypothetical protein
VEKHQTYFNFLDALKEGCPLCCSVRKSIRKAMDDFLYENVTDAVLQEEIRRGRGFCNRHAWQLRKFGDGAGQAIIYDYLLNQSLNELDAGAFREFIRKEKDGKPGCLFCKQEREAGSRYLSVFWDSFAEPEFRAAYKNSAGLCLPHLSDVLAAGRPSGPAEELVSLEKEKLGALARELHEFLRKHDYRFSGEGFREEGDSWVRAIEKFIGQEGLYHKGA